MMIFPQFSFQDDSPIKVLVALGKHMVLARYSLTAPSTLASSEYELSFNTKLFSSLNRLIILCNLYGIFLQFI